MNTKDIRDEIHIRRSFNAPKERLWAAWSEPEIHKQWSGPKDFTTPFSNINFRVGGKFLDCMQGPDGKKYWSTGKYTEIIPYEKIVCTDSFADEKGNKVPASYYGMSDTFPRELTITVTFKERDGKTVMDLRHSGIGGMGDADLEEMEQGWNQSFDKLAGVLDDMGPTLNY